MPDTNYAVNISGGDVGSTTAEALPSISAMTTTSFTFGISNDGASLVNRDTLFLTVHR
jgi:hypothetical protein